MSELTEAEVIASLARATRDTVAVADGVVAMHVPDNERLEMLDSEPYLPNPRRASGTQVLETEVAFAQYVELHHVEGDTAIYAQQSALQFTAVFDDHTENTRDHVVAGWRDWRAQLTLEHGESWKKWNAFHDMFRSQAEFIDLLEDRIDDVVSPPATDLLEIAKTFSMNKKVTFRSAVSLHTGTVQLQYDEEAAGIGGTAGANLEVPERIKLALHPIKGDDPVEVNARLRWKVTDGELAIMVKLDRLDDVLELAWVAVVERITAHVAPVPVLEGRP